VSYLLDLFRDGGPFMYLLVLTSPAGLIGAALPGVAAALRRRLPTAVTLLLLLVPVTLGAAGWMHSLGLVQDALNVVSDEMRAPLAAQGLAISFYPLVAGAFLSGLLAFGASGLDLLASFVAHREEEAKPATAASRRTGALALAGVGAGLFVVGRTAVAWSSWYQARAMASEEMRPILMARALEGLLPFQILFGGAAFLALGLAAAHALAVPASRTPRTAMGAAAALFILFLPASLPVLRVPSAYDIGQAATADLTP
jgi:hypothetical protein